MLDRLTLDQLRTLIAVADAGSFSAAGRRLRRVQSGISQTIQTLEETLGIALFARDGKTPVLTDAGRAILAEARRLIEGAEALRTRAQQIASDIEPELTLAVDAMFPNALVMEALKGVTAQFPALPVTLYTEALGGAEQRLRDGVARLGIFTPLTQALPGFVVEPLTPIALVPVAAAHHPLSHMQGPIPREALEEQVQLVLTDRTQITAGFSGGVISHRVWRFADLTARLAYLRAGFGWCNMPLHMVEQHIAGGDLVRLSLQDYDILPLPIAVAYARKHPPGRAGRWLMEALRTHLSACPPKYTGTT
jgi:DNA-binding transcriptional LysR family regulator